MRLLKTSEHYCLLGLSFEWQLDKALIGRREKVRQGYRNEKRADGESWGGEETSVMGRKGRNLFLGVGVTEMVSLVLAWCS